MFALRFLVLVFVVFLGLKANEVPYDKASDMAAFFCYSVFVAVPALYMLPTYEAWIRKNPNISSIALVNFFLGWSLIGWVFAIAWAFKNTESLAVLTTPDSATASLETKRCPYCAEEILVAAIKCKHCGSELAVTKGTKVVGDS